MSVHRDPYPLEHTRTRYVALKTIGSVEDHCVVYVFVEHFFCIIGFYVASYPGLLTLEFVAYSTNTGEGLVKLNHMQ